ncbi:hypothetical protein PM082_001504 [Marasmius tenuissimus]|nr:hypothetical protein PM082_001504 [Marasmius tenuissimus]
MLTQIEASSMSSSYKPRSSTQTNEGLLTTTTTSTNSSSLLKEDEGEKLSLDLYLALTLSIWAAGSRPPSLDLFYQIQFKYSLGLGRGLSENSEVAVGRLSHLHLSHDPQGHNYSGKKGYFQQNFSLTLKRTQT